MLDNFYVLILKRENELLLFLKVCVPLTLMRNYFNGSFFETNIFHKIVFGGLPPTLLELYYIRTLGLEKTLDDWG